MNIGLAIKDIRKSKGLSQKELAEKSQLSTNALCQLELNNTFPQKKTLESISNVLGVSVAYIVFKSITKDDVPDEKAEMFDYLKKPLESYLLESK